MTMTDEMVDLDQAIDLDLKLWCDHEDCADEAVWRRRLVCCHHSRLRCDHHRETLDRANEEIVSSKIAMAVTPRCHWCKRPNPFPHWTWIRL